MVFRYVCFEFNGLLDVGWVDVTVMEQIKLLLLVGGLFDIIPQANGEGDARNRTDHARPVLWRGGVASPEVAHRLGGELGAMRAARPYET